MLFTNRMTAGRKLAKALRQYADEDTIVLALPRGGVAVGNEVAEELGAPLGLIMVRKIGHPLHAEYAIGAIAEDRRPVYNLAESATIGEAWIAAAEDCARQLMAHRRKLYFGETYTPPEIKGNTVIIVDDGIATGLTMQAAVLAVRGRRPKKIVVAVPVAPHEAVDKLEKQVDEVVVLDTGFRGAVGTHYLWFPEVTDDTVKELLERRASHDIRQATAGHPAA